MKKQWIGALLLTMAAVWVMPVLAQDGPVTPQPQFVERPLATPRLSVARLPNLPQPDAVSVVDDVGCRVIGAAHNFAHDDARILIRPGTTVKFTIPEIEAVTYPNACGFYAIYIRFDVRGANTDWRMLDTYYRQARFCGPSLAQADDLEVNYVELRPGEYLVRAMIYTYAVPIRPDLVIDRTFYPCAGIAYNEVFTKVRVAEHPTPVDIEWEAVEPAQIDHPELVGLDG